MANNDLFNRFLSLFGQNKSENSINPDQIDVSQENLDNLIDVSWAGYFTK